MSQENVEIVREFYESIRRGDYAEALACLAPDVDYRVLQEGPARGPDAVEAMWERWESEWEEGGEAVAEEFIDAGDQIVATVLESGRGRGSGIEVDARVFKVFTFRSGKVVRMVEFIERADALKAAGLSE
jgi:ketosteroid isomerase-like protein